MTIRPADFMLANSIRRSTDMKLEDFSDQISANPSLATQNVADAFFTVAVNPSVGKSVQRCSALAGLLRVLQVNPDAANSTMVSAVNSFSKTSSNNKKVVVQAYAIKKLIVVRRPDLAQTVRLTTD